MKIINIEAGEIFCIEGTKTYPKLKLDTGYVDMRDEILQRSLANTANRNCELMTEKEVETEFKKYGMTMDDVKNLKRELSVRFN
uniref:Uncharacterized protein n=1 Tax=viral metagenome TaxID=1070528 RepID=A0A6H1ZXM0_9ZZZZ